MENVLKQKFSNGQKTIGAFVESCSALIVECLGRTGLDYVILDNEHSPVEAETSMEMIRAAELFGMTPIVRVRETSRPAIMKVLDVGAQGIIIPNVHSVAQVDEIVSYAKYQPIGKRGFAASRKDGWGFDAPDGVAAKMAYFNENTLVIPQCETRGALDAVEQIAAHPGVDGIFTGPYDLSIAMGMPGEFDRPEFQAALDRIVTACHENHKFCIIYAGVIENAAAFFKRGYDSVAYNVDTAILIEAYRDRVAQLRSMI